MARSMFVGFLFAAATATAAAQEPFLHASETAAYFALRDWQAHCVEAGFAGVARPPVGYSVHEFGYDDAGGMVLATGGRLARSQFASIVLFVPLAGSPPQRRAFAANSLGGRFSVRHVPLAGWRPELASLVGADLPLHLNNMMLDSGDAVDGTKWRYTRELDDLPVVSQRIRVVRADGKPLANVGVTVGHPRLAWDVGWLDVAGLDLVAMDASVRGDGAAAELVAKGSGPRARGLQLQVRTLCDVALLEPENVRRDDDEVVVTVPVGAFVDAATADQSTSVAEALRRFAGFQLAAKASAVIDRDRDGIGEFGAPDEVVPLAQRVYREADHGRHEWQGFLFEVHVPRLADAAETRFEAYAWPSTADDRRPFAFAVDERGVVHRCAAKGRFAGAGAPVPLRALADQALGWRRL